MENYRKIVASAKDIVFQTDTQGHCVFLSPKWIEVTDFSLEDSLGRSLFEFLHPGDRERARAGFRSVMQGEKGLWRDEFRLLTKSGELRWAESLLQLTRNRSGKVIGSCGALLDITAQKSALKAFFEEKERAQSILSCVDDAVVTTDVDGKIQHVNPAAERMLGLQDEQTRGRRLTELVCIQHELTHQRVCEPSGGCGKDGSYRSRYEDLILINRRNERIALTMKVSALRGHNERHFGCVIVLHDVSDYRALYRELEYQATHDFLTGLTNRNALREVLHREHAQAARRGTSFSTLLVDLDHFKSINDNYGHAAGDAVLVHATQQFRSLLRDGDWIGRWGGEEFLCILPNTPKAKACAIADRLRDTLAKTPVVVHEQTILVTTSIGVATYPEDAGEIDDLLIVTDSALYDAKRAGRDRVIAGPGRATHHTLSLGRQIEDGVRHRRFVPAYQPLIDLRSGATVAEECLARLVTDAGKILPAASFIDAASDLHLVHRIDHMMIHQALARCTQRILNGHGVPQFINVSANFLRHTELVEDLLQETKRQCAACGPLIGDEKPLVIEVTERKLLRDMQETRRILAPFLDFGLRLAIDDFGSGYSSFRYLADLPVSFIKIEGELVRRAVQDARVRSIVQGIRDIAGELEVITIAEYVEDEATANLLRTLGVDWAQGHWFGSPELSSLAEPGIAEQPAG